MFIRFVSGLALALAVLALLAWSITPMQRCGGILAVAVGCTILGAALHRGYQWLMEYRILTSGEAQLLGVRDKG